MALETIPDDHVGSSGDVSRSDVGRFRRAAIAGSLTASIPMLAVLWSYGFHPFRTTLPTRILSNVFDLQARAIMGGHLYVPRGSLGIEGYVVRHHEYTYFGILPALLRIPFLATSHVFDNRLTAPSMLAAWVLLVTFTSLLLWRVRVMVRGNAMLGRVEATAYATLIVAVGGGSVVLSLVALPWVYEEAQLWGAASAIGALFAIIGILERPCIGRIVAAGFLTTAAVLSREPDGWGCCLILAGLAVLILIRSRGHGLLLAGGVLTAAVLPLAIGVAINWAKFHTPFSVPFGAQVWTSLNLHRRQVLSANGGGLFGLQFLPSTLVAYLRPDGIRFISILPFVSVPTNPAASYGGAVLDVTYRTGSATSFMPLLFLLAAWGVVVAFGRRATKSIASFRVPIVGAAAMTAGVLTAGYIGTRYASDFLPVLVLAGVVGIVDLMWRAASWSRLARLAGLALIAGLATFEVVANLAVATTTSAQTSGGPLMHNLVNSEERISSWSGHPVTRYVERGSSLPNTSAPDHLRVIGDCQAVYMGTGDRYQPWLPVDVRGLSVDLTVNAPGGPGSIRLVTFAGYINQSIVLEHDTHGMYRFVVVGGEYLGTVTGLNAWRTLPTGTQLHLRVGTDVDNRMFVVYSPSMIYAGVPMLSWDLNHNGGRSGASSYVIEVGPSTPSEQAALGVNVSAAFDPPSKLCQGL